MNFYEKLDKKLADFTIDEDELQEQHKFELEMKKYDEFQSLYYYFFVETILRKTIENFIAQISIKNVGNAEEDQEFEVEIAKISEGRPQGFYGYLNYEHSLYSNGKYFNYDNYKHLKDKEIEDGLIDYIINSLKLYGFEIIENSNWKDGQSRSEEDIYAHKKYRRDESLKKIVFKGKIRDLFNMYYQESQMYFYQNKGMCKTYDEKSKEYMNNYPNKVMF